MVMEEKEKEEEEEEEEEKGWLLERYLEDQWSLVAKLCDWGGDDDDGAGDWCRGRCMGLCRDLLS